MKRLATMLSALFLLASCALGGELHNIRIGDVPLQVEIVNTPESRQLGLMHRESLAKDRGMLFVFPQQRQLSFWMKDTSIPLSIAFIDQDFVIRTIADMEPFSTESVPSRVPVKYALEVNKGFFEAHGIRTGQFLSAPAELLEARF